MTISRRNFFREAFSSTAQTVPKLLPGSVQSILGMVLKPEPLSPDEAAFALARKNSKNARPLPFSNPEISGSSQNQNPRSNSDQTITDRDGKL